jgi:hypothetical protein
MALDDPLRLVDRLKGFVDQQLTLNDFEGWFQGERDRLADGDDPDAAWFCDQVAARVAEARKEPSAIEQEAAARQSLGKVLDAYRARTAGASGR